MLKFFETSTRNLLDYEAAAGVGHHVALDELIRRDLAARKDPREVISDSHARYYGIQVSERTLVPNDGAQLGETRFENWLRQATKQVPNTARQSA